MIKLILALFALLFYGAFSLMFIYVGFAELGWFDFKHRWLNRFFKGLSIFIAGTFACVCASAIACSSDYPKHYDDSYEDYQDDGDYMDYMIDRIP